MNKDSYDPNEKFGSSADTETLLATMKLAKKIKEDKEKKEG